MRPTLCGRDGQPGSDDPRLDTGFGLPDSQEVDTILHDVVAFLTSRELALNFLVKLGGAMAGVLLAFWIECVRARRDVQTATDELSEHLSLSWRTSSRCASMTGTP